MLSHLAAYASAILGAIGTTFHAVLGNGRLFADLTLLLGLLLATWGSVLLGLDALGASEFVDTSEDNGPAYLKQLWITSALNTMTRYLALSLVGFALVLYLTRSWIVAVFFALFSFFAWTQACRALNRLHAAVRALQPPSSPNIVGCLLGLPIYLVWAALMLVTFAAATLMEFGSTLPTFWIGERHIQPLVRKFYTWLAGRMESERLRGFRESAFRGMVFLVIGFILQFVATIYLTLGDVHPTEASKAAVSSGNEALSGEPGK